MSPSDVRRWCTPREGDLGLRRIGNKAGLGISVLPNGAVFAIEHRSDSGTILVNQVLASSVDGGIGRILLRRGGASPSNIEAVGSRANVLLGVGVDRVAWEGVTSGIRHRVTLRLLPDRSAWLWRVEATNAGGVAIAIDAILVQDLGLGIRAFVTNNEAYASQYIDHHIARHARCGPVVMNRQNLAQDGKHPWVIHGCLDGASAFATDALQLFGPGHRDADGIRAAEPPQGANCSPSGGSAAAKPQAWGPTHLAFGTRLANRRLQHEASCAAIQSFPITLAPGASTAWRFFAFYEPDHPAASDDSDLTRLDGVAWPDRDDIELPLPTREVRRTLVQDAPSVQVIPLSVIPAAGPPQGGKCSPSGGSAAAKPQAWGSSNAAAGPPQGGKCAPSGGSAAAKPQAWGSSNAAAGPPQGGKCSPSGGSAAAKPQAWGSSNAAAGPPQGGNCSPSGASAAAELANGAASVGVRYPDRFLEEFSDGRLLSFFTPDPPHNRHVVLWDKERLVTRRHGALLRSGKAMLPDESTLCATCWMHGVFAAQLTIGNTSFHKLFSVSRDSYNIMRASGLRALIDAGNRWRLLTIPSAFEMGLSDCRWIYALADRVITVRAIASGDDPAMQWRISIDGAPCRLLLFGHLVLGERDLEHGGSVLVDPDKRRFTFRPDPDSPWGQRYPDAAYHLVTSTPDAVETIGGDELLYAERAARNGTHVAIRTLPTREFCFAVVGSLTDSAEAARLASKYEQAHEDSELLAPATKFWTNVTRGSRIVGEGAESVAFDASLPWFAHDAMIHLTVPRGLEQYTGAAWGTRDVCQGPVEFFLSLEHDEPVKQILRIVFAQQYAARGDWPQWFMLEPYSSIQDRHSHGDVIVWPLKALNDYLEATGDLAFLEETAPWRNDKTLERTAHEDTIAVHVEKLLVTVRERFIPGTHLIRYGEGDWNDSLQPADPRLRDAMVSSWTVALLYEQLVRYAEVLRRAGREDAGKALSELALTMRGDFNRFLIRDGTVAGYGLFEPGGDLPELLLHPSDVRTGLQYSLLPMTRSIIAGLFTPEQARHHLRIIRHHLLFPDGARLIDQPVAYRGGPERTFRRAESASFFGREIGLMYVHAHLRYGEAMAVLGEADDLWHALHVANPISVTERVANAAPRQRNAYFSSSDAAFPDRYEASATWSRVKAGTIAVEGGWRIYSSGPGLYVNLLLRHALGIRRVFGERVNEPMLPSAQSALRLTEN